MQPNLRPPRLATLVALALSALAAPAGAHPHVFVDAGIDFLFDDAGRLTHVRITWIYDPLTSLLMLEDLGIAERPDGSIGADGEAAIARDQTQWVEGYQGDGYLWLDGTPVALSGPIQPSAAYAAGKVEMRFLRRLVQPVDSPASISAKLYDPTYFVSYRVTEPPELVEAPGHCTVEVVPFEPTASLARLQRTLGALAPDEDPEEPVGALFADEVRLRCA